MRLRPLAERISQVFLCAGLSVGLSITGSAYAAEEISAVAPASTTQTELLQLIQKMNERLDRLEQRNAELERELVTARAQNRSAAEAKEDAGSASARVDNLEFQDTSEQRAARAMEFLDRLDKFEANLSFTSVAQSPSGVGHDFVEKHSQLNYRADLSLGVPLPQIGTMENLLFAHFRMGQGLGLNEIPVYARPNATAFRPLSFAPDDSAAVLGQIWYQGKIPFASGLTSASKGSLEFNFGKMDPFIFFDQNAVANDEAKQFLNTVFVHNALLDAGGDIGVDKNGFSPGIRVSYAEESEKWGKWRFSLGLFGAGRGADFSHTFSSPLFIAQAEKETQLFGRPGNYRLTYWHNGQAPGYDEAVYRRSGIGISADQEVGEGLTLFTRLAWNMAKGGARFDTAYSFGGELSGASWSRAEDVLGFAFGLQRTSNGYARDSAGFEDGGIGNGVRDDAVTYAYAASGYEKVAELYYRFHLSKSFELSPDFQYIRNPGGNSEQSSITIYGLRAQVNF